MLSFPQYSRTYCCGFAATGLLIWAPCSLYQPAGSQPPLYYRRSVFEEDDEGKRKYVAVIAATRASARIFGKEERDRTTDTPHRLSLTLAACAA